MRKFSSILLASMLLCACSEGSKSSQENSASIEQKSSQNQPADELKKSPENNFNKLVKFHLSLLDGSQLGLARTSLDNKDLSISAEPANDKALLFVFFTTWCEPCRAEFAHLNSLAKKFTDKLRIIGVAVEDKSAAELAEFAKKEGINYEIAAGEMNYTFMQVLDGFSGIPYAALYSKDGKNVANYTGIVAEEMLEVDILRATK